MLDYKQLPETPGVYLMKDENGTILYVGKAANLRRRVSSYFERPHDARIELLVKKIRDIGYQQTDTALEALILEASLIKKIMPPFNIREKDDKSFLYIEITKEKFPRVLLVRGKDVEGGMRYGPFTSASSVREALRIMRRIFPWSTHDPERFGKFKRPCFDFEIGLCPGTCVGAITREDYMKNIKWLQLFFEGKKHRIIPAIEKEMALAGKKLEFEKAEKFRRRIFALQHIQDTAFISESAVLVPPSDAPSGGGIAGSEAGTMPRTPFRIEGYDISNISGTSAVGSMVVFEDGEPNKDEYRKFRIKTIFQPNDVGMLTEMLERRFRHSSAMEQVPNAWPLPNLVLVDGGITQVNAARQVLMDAGLRIPVVGVAKGPERKRNDLFGGVPRGVQKKTLIRVRDEAHRFAIAYHKTLRGRRVFE
jgi:excinuclease ABC subunit C